MKEYFLPEKFSGIDFCEENKFNWILTQATRAKSLPGTSRIAAMRKLMKRVPVKNKISCINIWSMYNISKFGHSARRTA